MSKDSHPYFIANDPDAKTTATLLVGTADEFGIDQHDIQKTQGGYNVTEEIARALYGEDFDATETPTEDAVLTGQVLVPGEPVVTGTDKDGTATVATPAEQSPTPQETTSPDYSEWDYADLKAEISRRQIETEDKRAETLIAALTASDADLDSGA